MKSVLVVGAGMGGMATAVRLAAAGFSVRVLDKSESVGGKMAQVVADGYRFDTGPSLLTMPFVYRDLFAAAGRDLADYVDLLAVDPICRYFYPDKGRTVFDASSDLPTMLANIDRLNPHDGAGFLGLLAYSRRIYDATADKFLFNSLSGSLTRDMLGLVGNPANALKLDPLRTVHQAVSSYVRDPRLRQLFDRYATYNGSSPYRAPATLNIIPYVELGMGGWYSRGGIYALALAYRKLAEEMGVTFSLGAPYGVEHIAIKGRRAVAVNTAGGEHIHADIIVANTDVLYTYRNLLADQRTYASPAQIAQAVIQPTAAALPAKGLPSLTDEEEAMIPAIPMLGGGRVGLPVAEDRADTAVIAGVSQAAEDYAKLEPSCSGFVLLLGVRKQYSELAHHNIFFARNYPREFRDIFDNRVPPSDPTIYVCWSGKTDPDHAPPDCSNLFVLVNAPALSDAFEWNEANTRAYRDTVVKRLEEFGLDGLSDAIAYEQVMTPLDLWQRYNAMYGAIYGFSSNNRTSAFQRPPNRAPGVRGLYFVGGSTHPGGGVPLVTLSAKIVADLIVKNEGA